MVQIPEYTKRLNAKPMQRGGMNINLPNAFMQTPGGDAPGKALKLSGELADVYVNMKERRDDGIVSAFMNQYDKDSTQKLLQLEEQYRGQDAKRVMSEFQKWRDDYIAEHSSYDPDSAKEGVIYLEDAAQNRIAKKQLDAYNVRDINSISSYIAKEEEEFRINNINTAIENNATKIIFENILENTEKSKEIIALNVANRYLGQSPEFIKSKTDAILSSAIRSNILRNSNSDPLGSIDRYNDKTFTKELSEEDRIETRDEVLKSFKNYAAQSIAEDAAFNGKTEFTVLGALSNEFFDGLDVERIKRDIMDDAGKREKDIKQTKHENSINLQNDMVSKLYDRSGRLDPNRLTPEATMNISATEGGIETINTINHVRVNTQNDKYNIDNGIMREDLTNTQLERFNAAMNRVKTGYYRTIGDMWDDIYMLPSEAQNQVLGTFVANLKYDETVSKLKSSGIDVERDIRSLYEDVIGLKVDDSDSGFRIFREEFVNVVNDMDMSGKKLDKDSIRSAATSAVNAIYDPNSDLSVVKKLVIDLDKKKVTERKNLTKEGRVQDITTLKKWASDLSNEANLNNVFGKASMNKFNDLIVNGDVNGAYLMLMYYRNNRVSYDNMVTEQRKESRDKLAEVSVEDAIFKPMNYGNWL